ncbi:MAG: long-chain fatty acid--CoA ligase [Acidobacteriota bacterium]|nr:MAG: long-chain fatty acid--CoA ligase [Acidobacteriota bacterium]
MLEKPWQQFYDQQVPKSIDYPDLNLYQMFQMAVEDNPQGIATIFFGAKITYQKLNQLVSQFADGLAELGVKKGDRVALLLPNLPGYPVAHFAVTKLGGILVPTNPLYVERELQHQLNDSGAETVVTLDALYPKLAAVRSKTPVKRVIVMGIKDFLPWLLGKLYGLKNKSTVKSDESHGIYLYSDFMKRKYRSTPGIHVTQDETAMLLYTGGTTGVSKGAELTHGNVVKNAYQTRHWLWALNEKEEVILGVLPFFHSYGMTTALHLAITIQSTMLLLPRFELADVAKAIKRYRPTVFCAVPSMYNAVNRYPQLSSDDVSSIKLCVSGGAALPGEIQRKFEERSGGRLVEGYGLTETSPVAFVNPTHGHRKNGTIGVPVSDTDARVVDPDSKETLPVGEVGELAIKGPQVMKGYWNRPDETALALQDGWLFTGDMSVADEEGFFRIVDRKKDVIISAGMNIYPREVEEVLHQHPAIVEAAVIGVPSKVREETVKAYIVVEPGTELKKSDVVEFCRDKLSKFKIPKQIEFVEQLPKSAMGKILKRVLKQELKK